MYYRFSRTYLLLVSAKKKITRTEMQLQFFLYSGCCCCCVFQVKRKILSTFYSVSKKRNGRIKHLNIHKTMHESNNHKNVDLSFQDPMMIRPNYTYIHISISFSPFFLNLVLIFWRKKNEKKKYMPDFDHINECKHDLRLHFHFNEWKTNDDARSNLNNINQ